MPTAAPAWLPHAAIQHLQSALALRPAGLLTDIDGTISAIAPTPGEARLLPGMADLLGRASERFAVVAAISGRAVADARQLVGVPQITYIGNHGLERLEPARPPLEAEPAYFVQPAAQPYAQAIATILDAVGRKLAPRWPGLLVEQKGVSGSIHVRNTDDPTAAQAAVRAALAHEAEQHGVRVTEGKMVVELRPPVAVDKGTAIADLIRDHSLRAALYLGDDRTDLDAFRTLRRLTAEGDFQGVAIAVLHTEAPPELAREADMTIPSIEQVPEFLRWLLASQSVDARS